MVDTQTAPTAPSRSRMAMVLETIKERGEPPFGDVLEMTDAMEKFGLTDLDICIAVSRLVRNGQLQFALDGVRIVTP